MAKQLLNAGDEVKILLHDGREVRAEYVAESDCGIIVKNGKDMNTGKVRRNNQNFYCSEIKSIIKIKVNQRTNDTAANVMDENKTSNETLNETPNESQVARVVTVEKLQFTEVQIENIQQLVKQTVHIAQHDEKYHSAVDDLKRQDIITVNSENNFGRLSMKRPLLTLTTPTKVYMFDMLRLGPMKKEFKEVFSSHSVRKVVHSSTEFADYLVHKEMCTINNVFDTLMVHWNLVKNKVHMDLKTCYTTYFQLPDDFILQKFDFDIRPLSKESMIQAAFNSLLLMKLYWHMNDILMRPLYIASKQFAQTYPNVSHQVDLMMHMNKQIYPGSENIDLNAIELLDKELELVDLNKVI